MTKKEIRRKTAEENKATRASRTNAQQLKELEKRSGNAKKETTRLREKIKNGEP